MTDDSQATGTCNVCHCEFTLKANLHVPKHDNSLTDKTCEGSGRPPAITVVGESKADFEISSRHTIIGNPGSGRRR